MDTRRILRAARPRINTCQAGRISKDRGSERAEKGMTCSPLSMPKGILQCLAAVEADQGDFAGDCSLFRFLGASGRGTGFPAFDINTFSRRHDSARPRNLIYQVRCRPCAHDGLGRYRNGKPARRVLF